MNIEQIVEKIKHNNRFWIYNNTMDAACKKDINIRKLRSEKFDETIQLYNMLK